MKVLIGIKAYTDRVCLIETTACSLPPEAGKVHTVHIQKYSMNQTAAFVTELSAY